MSGVSRDTKHLSCRSANVSSLASKVSPYMTKSSDSFRTVPFRVDEIDCRLIVLDLGSTIILVLLAFNFASYFAISHLAGIGDSTQLLSALVIQKVTELTNNEERELSLNKTQNPVLDGMGLACLQIFLVGLICFQSFCLPLLSLLLLSFGWLCGAFLSRLIESVSPGHPCTAD